MYIYFRHQRIAFSEIRALSTLVHQLDAKRHYEPWCGTETAEHNWKHPQNCSTALLACHKKRRGWITYPSCASLKKMCRSVHKCPAETSAVETLPSRPKRQQLEFQRFFAIPKTSFLTFLGPLARTQQRSMRKWAAHFQLLFDWQDFRTPVNEITVSTNSWTRMTLKGRDKHQAVWERLCLWRRHGRLFRRMYPPSERACCESERGGRKSAFTEQRGWKSSELPAALTSCQL